MKNKKIIMMLILFFSLFLLSCNKLGREINTQFIDFNIESDYSKIGKNEYIDYYNINYDLYNISSVPLVTLKNDNRLAVYSLLLNRFIYEFNDVLSIDYLVNYYFPNYFVVTYLDYQKELYDYYGNTILPKGTYDDLNITISRNKEKNYFIYTETITYYSNSDKINIIYVSKEDISNRVLYSDDSLTTGDKITFVPIGIELEKYGLPGYYMIELNNKYGQIYNSDHKLVSTINFNLDFQFNVIFGGYFIYQNVLLLDHDEKEYDYAIEVNNDLLKYKLITNRIDLKTGETKEIDLDYIIIDGSSCKDKNGIYNYANVRIQLIENKRLQPIERFIIDNECDIIYNFANSISLESLIRLDSKHYFDNNSHRLYDSKMNLIFDFKNNDLNISFDNFDFSNKIIKCKRNNKYGFINYELEVIIPFEYDAIGDYFISNLNYAVKNDNLYIIDLSGSLTMTNLAKVDNCPLLYKVVQQDNMYYYSFYNYSLDIIFEYCSFSAFKPTFNRIYYNGLSYYYMLNYNAIIENNQCDTIFTLVTSDIYG